VVQKEVAERWTAATGASVSTLAVQVFATARMDFVIPASAFTPQPRVDSALVILDVRDRPAIDVPDFDAFFRFTERVFQQRRKQLGGTLGRINGQGSDQAASRLRDAGIDPQRRPQTLSLAEWEAIFRSFAGTGG
jgi:16S rRNA (adenine1518-N6/adenine1519-N6)-dimethyltransferase